MEPITKTLALYRETKYDFTVVADLAGYQEIHPDYVRISEPLEVTFAARNEAVVQERMIEQLIHELSEVNQSYEKKVNDLNQRIDELRALPAPQAAA